MEKELNNKTTSMPVQKDGLVTKWEEIYKGKKYVYTAHKPYPVQLSDDVRGYKLKIYSDHDKRFITANDLKDKKILGFYRWVKPPTNTKSVDWWILARSEKDFHYFTTEEGLAMLKRKKQI